MLSIAACEIVDDRFSTSLKCSAHRSSMRLGSVSRVSAPALNIDEEPFCLLVDRISLWGRHRKALRFFCPLPLAALSPCRTTIVPSWHVVTVTLNTPNNLEHVRIFIHRAPTPGSRKHPNIICWVHIAMKATRHILSSTRKVPVYLIRKSIFPLTRKSIRLLERFYIRMFYVLETTET